MFSITYKISFMLLSVIFHITFAQTNSVKSKKFQNKQTNISPENIKLLNNVYSKLSTTYVDTINESEMILSGIKGMLDPLDPYTRILMGKSKENYEMLAKGKYGGVGMSISSVRDTIIIRQVFEDSPSYFEGLMSGDMILEIDSISTIGLKYSEAVKLLKGEVDTPVKLLVFRKPEKIKKEFILRRSSIKLQHIPYWGMDDNKIGYIKLTKFSRNTSKYFREALISMSENDFKGLIIDLRSNGGGLLKESINILDLLLPKDLTNPILIKKGRSNEKKYYSRNEPVIDLDIPIILLQDKKSASASEIVAGTLQDLDRAIISGQNSVGKGLVQMNNPLNDSMNIKITTSKYYLPSGRLIQKNDFLGNSVLTDGLDKKDSLFYTLNNRVLMGGGGIQPDILTNKDAIPAFVSSLSRSHKLFISFTNNYGDILSRDIFELYEAFLKNKYKEDYLDLDSTIFCTSMIKSGNYFRNLLENNTRKVELIKENKVIRDVSKLYKHLNRYERYQNLSYKNIHDIIIYAYQFKEYYAMSDSLNLRPSSMLSQFLNENNLYFAPKNKNNKLIAGHTLHDLLFKLLNVINDSIDLIEIEEVNIYIDGLDYGNIDLKLENIKKQKQSLLVQVNLQKEIIRWYMQLFYNIISSPHSNVPMSQDDMDFIKKKFNLSKKRTILVREFKNYIDKYNFDYRVSGELELENLKKKLNESGRTKIDDDISKGISSLIKGKKYKKLFKGLDKYIKKNKEKYFFKDKNLKWILNQILREYSKVAINNAELVRTSLYIDSEYNNAIDLCIDIERYNSLLSIEK